MPFCLTSPDGLLDFPAHQSTGQYKRPGSRQPGHRPDRFGQLFFAHQRNRVHRDPLPAQIVAIRLRRGSDSYLANLGAAADDDDSLAENPPEGLFLFHLLHCGQGSEFIDKGLGVGYAGYLKEDRFERFPAVEYRYPGNVAA